MDLGHREYNLGASVFQMAKDNKGILLLVMDTPLEQYVPSVRHTLGIRGHLRESHSHHRLHWTI